MSIALRLDEALTAAGQSKRAFIKAMTARGTPGSSEPAVYRYLRGESEPSLSFLTEAAEELKVRREWLAFGDGAPTEEEEQARRRRTVRAADRRKGPSVAWWGEFCQGWEWISPESQAALVGALEKWVAARANGSIRGDVAPADNPVGRVFNDTLETLGIDAATLTPAQLDKFATFIALALTTAIPTGGAAATPEEKDEEQPDGE